MDPVGNTTHYGAGVVGAVMTLIFTLAVVLGVVVAVVVIGGFLYWVGLLIVNAVKGREYFSVVDNEGTRTYKAELTSDQTGWQQMSSGIVQMTKPRDNSYVKLEFECSLPEPQATFVYHRAPEDVCQCKDNCHWDSECECGGCSTFKAVAVLRDGSELPLGNLIRHGDGVSRLRFSDTGKDIVGARVVFSSKKEGVVPVLGGMFY